MPARQGKCKRAECSRCRRWRVNEAFVRARKAYGSELRQFETCNKCSRAYRKGGRLSKAEFLEKYRGRDHADSDSEDDDEADMDEDGNENAEALPKKDENDDQGDGSGQGGMGHAVTVA